MKSQQIDLKELMLYKEQNDEVVYASQMPLKRIVFTLYGGYRVYHNGEIAHEGIQPFTAVEKYNEI